MLSPHVQSDEINTPFVPLKTKIFFPRQSHRLNNKNHEPLFKNKRPVTTQTDGRDNIEACMHSAFC